MTRVEFTTAEKLYTIGALEMALKSTQKFLEETKRKGMPTDVVVFAIKIYEDALTKLRQAK